MPDKSSSDFYCDLDKITELSKAVTSQIEALQDTYVAVQKNIAQVQAEELLKGQYFDHFLEEYTIIEEWYLRYTAMLMVFNVNLGNITNNVETLIATRDALKDYL